MGERQYHPPKIREAITMKEVRERLKAGRLRSNHTQAEAAKAARLSRAAVCNMEQGKQTIGLSVFVVLCHVYGLDPKRVLDPLDLLWWEKADQISVPSVSSQNFGTTT